ncbi:hypothetical protein XF35_16770 [Streptomyces platensis subsp. clarensis]|nr:hypothetical protein [Streptomyces platensis subsp. clarensis]
MQRGVRDFLAAQPTGPQRKPTQGARLATGHHPPRLLAAGHNDRRPVLPPVWPPLSLPWPAAAPAHPFVVGADERENPPGNVPLSSFRTTRQRRPLLDRSDRP